MDAIWSEFIENAASISTSGRWEAVNDTVRQWAARPKTKDQLWYGELFASLCFRVFSEYSALKRAFEPPADDLAHLAWRARNLLELSVWTQFCAIDRAQAWQFYGDLGRDANNVLNSLKKWGEATNQSGDWFESGADARDELARRASNRGVESIEGRFTEVKDAAERIGISHHFAAMNKLLSKFAHPTAMLILSSSESNQIQTEWVFANGCLFFVGAFTALEKLSKNGI